MERGTSRKEQWRCGVVTESTAARGTCRVIRSNGARTKGGGELDRGCDPVTKLRDSRSLIKSSWTDRGAIEREEDDESREEWKGSNRCNVSCMGP